MPVLRSLLLLPTLLVLAKPDGNADLDSPSALDWRETLRTLPDESLALALADNLKPQYQDGVFESGHDAVEAVHSNDPQLASKLVSLAKQDADVKQYLKRQNNNSTGSTSTSSTTSSPVLISSESSSSTSTSNPQSSPSVPETPASSSTPAPVSPPAVAPSSTPGETPSLSSPVDSSLVTSTSTTSVSAPTSSMAAAPPAQPSSSMNAPESSAPPVSSTVSSTSQEQGSPPSVSESPASPTPDRSEATGVLVPVPVMSTSEGNVFESTSLAFQPSAPTSVAVTRTSNGVVSTSQVAAIVQSSTDAQGNVGSTAVPLTSAVVAPGGSIVSEVNAPPVTSTDAGGNVLTVTYRPEGGTVRQLELLTTVLPDGMQTVITSYAEVEGATRTADSGAAGTPQSTDQPDLQSGAAAPSSWYAAEVAIVLGAAIGVAGMVL